MQRSQPVCGDSAVDDHRETQSDTEPEGRCALLLAIPSRSNAHEHCYCRHPQHCRAPQRSSTDAAHVRRCVCSHMMGEPSQVQSSEIQRCAHCEELGSLAIPFVPKVLADLTQHVWQCWGEEPLLYPFLSSSAEGDSMRPNSGRLVRCTMRVWRVAQLIVRLGEGDLQ